MKDQLFGVNTPDILAIYITINTFQWTEFSKPVGQFQAAKIADMPDLGAVVKMSENGFVEVAMRV